MRQSREIAQPRRYEKRERILEVMPSLDSPINANTRPRMVEDARVPEGLPSNV
jgi:hypothetical protein